MALVIQNESNDDDIRNNTSMQTNKLTSIFHHHGDQFLKFHFLPLLNVQERANLRTTCQTIKNNIPTPQYAYFKTKDGQSRARIEINTGYVESCGRYDSSSVSSNLQSVKTIFATNGAFAALKNNGRVITWGDSDFGGDSSNVNSDLQSDVKTIFSSWSAFAALKTNGSVITWGYPEYGGDSSDVSSDLQSDVKTIFSTYGAFAALKTNESVITWGDYECGGDSSNVESDLQSDVKSIVSNHGAFAALKTNGRVITWGDPDFGGDSSNCSAFLQNGVIQVEAVHHNSKFRATKYDGTQVQWP